MDSISCGALAGLASAGSAHLALFADATKRICSDCEAECRKHAHHAPCTTCADSCAACVKACDALLA